MVNLKIAKTFTIHVYSLKVVGLEAINTVFDWDIQDRIHHYCG